MAHYEGLASLCYTAFDTNYWSHGASFWISWRNFLCFNLTIILTFGFVQAETLSCMGYLQCTINRSIRVDNVFKTLAQRPVTGRFIDVGSTDTTATRLNMRQKSSSVVAASSDGTINRCRLNRHYCIRVEQQVAVSYCHEHFMITH